MAMAMDYLDFALLIGAGEDGRYRVTVLDSPSGEGRARMQIPGQLQAFLQAIEGTDYEGGRSFAPARQEAPTQSLSGAVQEIGRALFASLIQESVRDCYCSSLDLARKEGKGLRLRLRIEPPELARLPWEFLHEGKPESDYLSLSKTTPVVRHLQVALPIESLTLTPPIRLLGMVGARHGLDVAAEQRRMAKAIDRLTDKGSGAIQLAWVEGHTARALSSALERGPWHVFHFIGHGGFDEQTGEGLVLLEKEGEEGMAQPFPARDLGRLLHDHPSLKLAVLNSCEGARASATNVFSSSGALLAGRGIPAVVSMQYAITDRAATEFSLSFYDSLADGKPVDEAVAEARKAIKSNLGETVEWGTPVLHMRAKDGVLFHLDLDLFQQPAPTAAPTVPAPAPPLLPGPADAQGLQILLRKVRQFWIQGVLERSIERWACLELGIEKVKGDVTSPWGSLLETPNAGSEPMPAGRSLGEVFEEIGGSLLVLGEPGSGKTVTLLELARDLLARAEQDPAHPVPVVFTLSSWTDPSRGITDWLVDELAIKYRIPKKVGQAWLAESHLLPLLDGLDEVRTETRYACVEAINNAFPQESLTGVVVCCRLKEYLALPTRLALNGAIRLQLLSRDQVLAYLAAAGERLAALSQLLRKDSAMLLEARSPLMLTLMVQAYQGLPVEALVAGGAGSLDARRRKLMDAYVARRFAVPDWEVPMPDQGMKNPPCTEEQATRWLGWLARGMQKHGQTVFLIEQLQPSWLPTGTATWSYSLTTRLIGSLIATLALASGFLSLTMFPMRSLVFGTWLGASFGLTSGWRFFQWRQDRRQGSSGSDGSLQRLRRFLVSSLIGVLFAGGTGILIFGPNDIFYGALALLLLGPPLWVRFRRKPTDDIRMVETMGWSWPGAFRGAGKALLVSALIACFPFLIVVVLMVAPPMIVFGAMFGGLEPKVVEMKAFPLQGIRLSLRNAGLAAVAVGLPVGLTVWRVTSSLDDIRLPGPFLGASAALVAALSFGGLDVIYHYLLRFILTV